MRLNYQIWLLLAIAGCFSASFSMGMEGSLKNLTNALHRLHTELSGPLSIGAQKKILTAQEDKQKTQRPPLFGQRLGNVSETNINPKKIDSDEESSESEEESLGEEEFGEENIGEAKIQQAPGLPYKPVVESEGMIRKKLMYSISQISLPRLISFIKRKIHKPWKRANRVLNKLMKTDLINFANFIQKPQRLTKPPNEFTVLEEDTGTLLAHFAELSKSIKELVEYKERTAFAPEESKKIYAYLELMHNKLLDFYNFMNDFDTNNARAMQLVSWEGVYDFSNNSVVRNGLEFWRALIFNPLDGETQPYMIRKKGEIQVNHCNNGQFNCNVLDNALRTFRK